MSYPNFPTLTSTFGQGEDSKYFTITPDDPAMRAPLEGGYEFTRARYTRTPRNSYTSGFSYLTNDDKLALENFYKSVMGGSLIFNWKRPTDGVVILVRFTEPMNWKYVGKGWEQRWDVTFRVKEA